MSTNVITPPRAHIYEFDLLRALTAITVVAVHTLAFTTWVYSNGEGVVAHYAVLDAIHWTRNVFLFITAFVLTYVYYGRPFSIKRFWIKRGVGVLFPYALWSIAYTWVNNPASHQPLDLARLALSDIITGSASYQLYYIMLTLQLYLVLPLFLALMQRIARHPWPILGISLALELAFTYVSYQYLQQGTFSSTSLGQFLNVFQNRFLLTYQFFVLLGAYAALNMDRARAFLLKHGRLVVGAFLLGLVIALVDYAYKVQVYRANPDLASFVLQPAETVYSIAVIVFLSWLGIVWVSRSRKNDLPPAYGFWHTLSDSSFGIYLVQAFVLDVAILQVLPQMPGAWPAGIRIFLTWVLGASVSALISIILLQIPGASRLVGRPAQWRSLWPVTVISRRMGSQLPPSKVQVER